VFAPQAVSHNTFVARNNTAEEFDVLFIDLSITKPDVNLDLRLEVQSK